MLEAHKELFREFKELHNNYVLNPEKWKEKFNRDGQDVLRLIKRWENNLCGKSEGGKYAKFSSILSQKFWDELRTIFPKIDEIGMIG